MFPSHCPSSLGPSGTLASPKLIACPPEFLQARDFGDAESVPMMSSANCAQSRRDTHQIMDKMQLHPATHHCTLQFPHIAVVLDLRQEAVEALICEHPPCVDGPEEADQEAEVHQNMEVQSQMAEHLSPCLACKHVAVMCPTNLVDSDRA